MHLSPTIFVHFSKLKVSWVLVNIDFPRVGLWRIVCCHDIPGQLHSKTTEKLTFCSWTSEVFGRVWHKYLLPKLSPFGFHPASHSGFPVSSTSEPSPFEFSVCAGVLRGSIPVPTLLFSLLMILHQTPTLFAVCRWCHFTALFLTLLLAKPLPISIVILLLLVHHLLSISDESLLEAPPTSSVSMLPGFLSFVIHPDKSFTPFN